MSFIVKLIRYGKKRYVEYKYKKAHDYCVDVFRMRLIKNKIPAETPAPGEDEYIKFWKRFHKRVEPYTYRYFQPICGNNPHIVPEDIANRYIAPILNPIRFRSYYSDKNMYQYYIHPKEALPFSYLFRVLGGSMYSMKDNGQEPISFDLLPEEIAAMIDQSVNKLVLKPSIDSNSGQKVVLFNRVGSIFCSSEVELSGRYLSTYGSDFVLQEAIEQHPFLGQFSKTSTNTMRVMTYRSLCDDQIHIFAACLRIGKNGSFVDNLFAGGCFVPINIETGKLGKNIYNKYWQKETEINGVNFDKSDFILPFWDEVKIFAEGMAKQVMHARLIAHDIIVDSKGFPRMIEYNVNDFDWALAMVCTCNCPFGDKFDEVIDFCLRQKV